MSNTQRVYESERYYKFSPFARNWVATSGIMNYCETNQCHWVLDIIGSYIPAIAKKSKVDRVDYLLTIKVIRNKLAPSKLNPYTREGGAMFAITQQDMHDDNKVKILILQKIEFTDLEEDLKFWAINSSTDNFDSNQQTVLMLPEEY